MAEDTMTNRKPYGPLQTDSDVRHSDESSYPVGFLRTALREPKGHIS